MRLTIGKNHAELEQSSCPECIVLARNTAFPDLQIEDTLRISLRLCEKTERMITSPLLALLLESVLTQRHLES